VAVLKNTFARPLLKVKNIFDDLLLNIYFDVKRRLNAFFLLYRSSFIVTCLMDSYLQLTENTLEKLSNL
jgi:hypothetical protein